MQDEVLTLPAIAQLLKVEETAVHTLAQEGALPVFKVRGQGRLRRVDAGQWIDERKEAPRDDEESV